MLSVIGALLLALPFPATSQAASFARILGQPITRPISDAFARFVGRSLPVISASAGVVYSFDPATGVYERETSILGQLFLERPDALGRRRWNLNFSYQRVKIDSFEGQDVDSLSDSLIRDPGSGVPLDIRLFDLALDTHQFTASATYGLTDDVDLNVTIPVLYSEFSVRLEQFSLRQTQVFSRSASRLGLGDTLLRGKYSFMRSDWIDAAAGLVLRLPTGNENDFQGTGDVELAPMLYAATRTFQPRRWLRLQPYLNGGMNVDASDLDASEGRWGAGLDCGVSQRLTAAVAVLGRHALSRLVPAGSFDVRRLYGPPRPLFGLQGDRSDSYDLSIGGRVNVWRDTVMAFANVIIPLNDDGVRPEPIPTVGFEATF
jgi:hypothetical protein